MYAHRPSPRPRDEKIESEREEKRVKTEAYITSKNDIN